MTHYIKSIKNESGFKVGTVLPVIWLDNFKSYIVENKDVSIWINKDRFNDKKLFKKVVKSDYDLYIKDYQ